MDHALIEPPVGLAQGTISPPPPPAVTFAMPALPSPVASARRGTTKPASKWAAYWSFEWMLVPDLIRRLHIVAVVGCVTLGIVTIVQGFESRWGPWGRDQDMKMVFSGVAIILLGPLISRIYSEFFIVVFRIHEALASIDSKLQKVD
jgi:hypothetical protein